jgi:hypothetical protein
MDGMRVELLVVSDCPHEVLAAGVLRTALDDIGLGSVGYTVTVVDTQEHADRRHFVGSPTICVDGQDIFAEPERPKSVSCRIYPGVGAVPELGDLRQALKRAAAASASR